MQYGAQCQMIGIILYITVPTSRLYDFRNWILCSDDWWQVQTWQMLCGLKQYWPTWMSKRVTGTSGQKRWNTRYPKYPMILKKNRVRIGYCQKISGRVGYRVPVRPWVLNMTSSTCQSIFSQSVFPQSIFSQSVYPQSLFCQSVFIQSVFLRNVPDLRVF